jgi:ABC-type branched-subunit amino acid transport system substrate-binding protein
VLAKTDGVGSIYYAGARNAIQMALQFNPTIHGFPVKLNDSFDAPCAGDAALAQNAAQATAVVQNLQNVGVIGHFCSFSLAGTVFGGTCPGASDTSALSIYEESKVVLISGSTTNVCLPTVGPTVFNAAIVSDPFEPWYSQVNALPSDRLWRFAYRIEFGVAPTDFADLYFDATRLLLTRLDETARVVNGHLVVDRAALAQAVRHTRHFPGVTCTIMIDPTTGFRVNDPAALARCGNAAATRIATHILSRGHRR